MRALSAKQAGACENATTTTCRCRCGGVFHGAKRVASIAELPDGDPHAGPRRRKARKELVHGQEPWRQPAEQLAFESVRVQTETGSVRMVAVHVEAEGPGVAAVLEALSPLLKGGAP